MVKLILAAILSLQPSLPSKTASHYAKLIAVSAARYDVPPLLIVAIMNHESQFQRGAVSITRDYGLMQLHVSSDTRAHYLGRERMLFTPKLNVRLGAKALRWWRGVHAKCKASGHPWWSHYQWGVVVRSTAWGKRIQRVYQTLRRKYRGAV